MFRNRTTFILGAGASCDFNFPTGAQLQKIIASALSPSRNNIVSDDSISAAILEISNGQHEISAYVNAGRAISAAMPYAASIDNFLHAHSDNKFINKCGKMAIVRAILMAEEGSILNKSPYFEREDDFQNSWYSDFFKMLNSGYERSDPEGLFDNINFIVFNYDRVLEYSLVRMLCSHYLIHEEYASEIVEKIEIIHPYGDMGRLSDIRFGSKFPKISEISEGIKTFTEVVESRVGGAIKQMVASSEVLVFMGFGFLERNIDLLVPSSSSEVKKIYCSGMGISGRDRRVVADKLDDRFIFDREISPYNSHAKIPVLGGSVIFDDETCRDVIVNNRFQLMP